MTIPILPIHGTFAYDGEPSEDEWTHPRSLFFRYMRQFGIVHACPDELFLWTGEVDGVFRPLRAKKKHLIWRATGSQVAYRLRQIPYERRFVYGHSHGGNVGIYAIAEVPVRVFVTIATPVREDMRETARIAAANCGLWIHVHSDWSDRMQVLGSLFDGVFGIVRTFDGDGFAGVQNVGIPGVGHSKILTDTDAMHWWQDSGTIDLIRAAAVGV